MDKTLKCTSLILNIVKSDQLSDEMARTTEYYAGAPGTKVRNWNINWEIFGEEL